MILSTIIRLILAALLFAGAFYGLVNAFPALVQLIFLGTILFAAIGLGSALLLFTPIEALCWAKGKSGLVTSFLVLVAGAVLVFIVFAISGLVWGGPLVPRTGAQTWFWVGAGIVWALIWRLTALPTMPLRRRARAA